MRECRPFDTLDPFSKNPLLISTFVQPRDSGYPPLSQELICQFLSIDNCTSSYHSLPFPPFLSQAAIFECSLYIPAQGNATGRRPAVVLDCCDTSTSRAGISQTPLITMPTQSTAEASSASQRWPQESSTSDLPSFYSPPSKPAQETTGNSANPNQAAHSSSGEPTILSPIPTHDRLTLDTPASAPSSTTIAASRGEVPPPPSLLSPSFTPPATPGTPATEGNVPRLKSVPVDSSIPSGGCGAKRPRLLETLPNVECIVRARIPTVSGSEMFLHLYTNDVDNKEHLAIVFGPHIRSTSLDAPRPGETEMDRMIRGAYVGKLFPGRTTSQAVSSGSSEEAAETSAPAPSGTPLVRIHSECYTGETAWSARCDCGEQLDEAARLMSHPDNTSGGIIVYLRQEGRGIGLGEKLKAYNLQDLGSDTVEANLLLRHPADARSYGLATAMLRDLGQEHIRLLTNNPDKVRAVEGPNREVVVTERVAMVPLSWRGEKGIRSNEVQAYLETKVSYLPLLVSSKPNPLLSFNLVIAMSDVGILTIATPPHRLRRWATCLIFREEVPVCS